MELEQSLVWTGEFIGPVCLKAAVSAFVHPAGLGVYAQPCKQQKWLQSQEQAPQ